MFYFTPAGAPANPAERSFAGARQVAIVRRNLQLFFDGLYQGIYGLFFDVFIYVPGFVYLSGAVPASDDTHAQGVPAFFAGHSLYAGKYPAEPHAGTALGLFQVFPLPFFHVIPEGYRRLPDQLLHPAEDPESLPIHRTDQPEDKQNSPPPGIRGTGIFLPPLHQDHGDHPVRVPSAGIGTCEYGGRIRKGELNRDI